MFHIIRLRERRLALISFSLSLSLSITHGNVPNLSWPPETFSISMEIFPSREISFIFLRFKSLNEENETSSRESFFSMAREYVFTSFRIFTEMELFSRKFSFHLVFQFFLWQMYKSLWDNIDKIFDFIAAVWNKHRLFFEYPIFGFEITGRVKLWKISNVSLLFSVQR